MFATLASVTNGQTFMLARPMTSDITEHSQVDVIAMNETSAAINFTPPESIEVVVRSSASSNGVGVKTLELVSPRNLVTLAPGDFARTRYALVGIDLRDQSDITIGLPGSNATLSLSKKSDQAEVEKSSAPSKSESTVTNIPALPTPVVATEGGLVEYLAYRFRPHEPVYFLGGDADPIMKYQISFKYQLFDPEAELVKNAPLLGHMFLAYSQTSFWDIDSTSSPFFDSSYRPQLFFEFREVMKKQLPEGLSLNIQAGIGHESNGRGGDESRSLNTVFLYPTLTIGDRTNYFLSVGPRFFTYIGDVDDNPDINEFRGDSMELKLVAGKALGLQLAATGRLGNDYDKGSIQLDLSMPIRQLAKSGLDVYFHTQYFNGFGESLLNYNQQGQSLRFGVSIIR